MPRKRLIRNDLLPYHVTNRTREKVFYPLPLSEMWSIYADQLRIATWAFGAQIHAFVLMSNHYHLLLSAPDFNLDEIIRFVQSEVSRKVFEYTHTMQFCFATRYRWTLIHESYVFWNVYRYIYQNPLRAHAANSVQHYPFSTFHGKAGYSKLDVPLYPNIFQEAQNFPSIFEEENWLDETLPEDQLALIRKGIRRFEFKLRQREQAKLLRNM